jgi:hypothetical protein
LGEAKRTQQNNILLRISKLGILIDFNVPILKEEIKFETLRSLRLCSELFFSDFFGLRL